MSHKHDHNEKMEPDPTQAEAETPENEAAPAAEAEKPAEAETPKLTELEKAQAALAEMQGKYLYLQAEYQNYRKRTARDVADVRLHTIADTLIPFLAVADYLGMAGAAAEKSDNLDAIKQGLKMIIGEFDKAFDELGIKKLKSCGEKFNPELHEAVGHEASEEVPEGVIIREWNSGYQLGDKLLRPARVMVSSGKPAAEAEQKTE